MRPVMNRKSTGTFWSHHGNRHLALAIYALAAVLLSVSLLPSRAEASGRGVTVRYGQTCMMGYGAPEGGVRLQTAMENLRAYFGKKGMDVQMVSHSRHFIWADIFKDGDRIDSIVFDISTGRMRSVY
jgi:hypothetical protein